MLSGQVMGPRFGGRELGAALGIRDRGRHQLGELRDALLGVGREAFARVGDQQDAPQFALDDDRGSDS